MKIVVCGGGTAGHIVPALAVIDALRASNSNVQILYIGSGSALETQLLKERDLKYKSVSAGKFRRYRRGWKAEITDVKTASQNFVDAVKLSKGYIQSRSILRKFKPDVVFTKGGYVTVPVGLAAAHKKIPPIIHESDAILGLSTKILAKHATSIATGFPTEVFSNLSYRSKIVFCGNPVRKELLSNNPVRAKKTFNFKSNKPIVLLFAGSLGAMALNEVVFENLELILRNYNFIHHTGSQGIEQARIAKHQLPSNLADNYQPYDFLGEELSDALFLADVVIGRAGANSIAEFAAHSKALIVVPSPYSANNHQQKNAEVLMRYGAARILQQNQLTPVRLCSEIERIVSDTKAKKYLQQSLHEFWVPDSAERIVKLILKASK